MRSGERSSDVRRYVSVAASLAVLVVGACVLVACGGDADGDGYTVQQGDCDDTDPYINPFATEVCDGVDQDCDGNVDEGLTVTYYPDADGDGHGVEAGAEEMCGLQPGYASSMDDCDDTSPERYPGATEACNGVDDDCDGEVDEGAASTFYEDSDGDGYGAQDVSVQGCVSPEGYVSDGSDCNDADPDIHPWVADEPNGVDDDCNGTVDDLFLEVAAGQAHSLALRSDGTVWAWGDNTHGQLGDGTTLDSLQPVQVVGLSRVTAIAAGDAHSLALVRSGPSTVLVAWGGNSKGQLGIDTTADVLEPVSVPLDGPVLSVAAGAHHTLAVVSVVGEGAQAWSWGDNSEGQLGNGTLDDSTAPVQVKTVRDVIGVAAGAYHSFALEAGGAVYAWGRNDEGQLGDGTIMRRISPVEIATGGTVAALAAGFGHSVGVDEAGLLLVWGIYDEDADAGTADVLLRPSSLEAPADVSLVACGNYHAVAVDQDGVPWTWGRNDAGQLGDGTTADDWTPAERPAIAPVSAVAAGASHTLAITADGRIWAWGANDQGQLGDWTTEDRSSPVEVKWSL